jgi:hypothetical protein
MNRRGLVSGLGTLFICAPAIVRASSLMPLSIQPRIPVPANMMLIPKFYPIIYPEVALDSELRSQLRVVADLVESNLEFYSGKN